LKSPIFWPLRAVRSSMGLPQFGHAGFPSDVGRDGLDSGQGFSNSHFGSARAHPGRSGFLKLRATVSFRGASRWRSRCGLEGRAPIAP